MRRCLRMVRAWIRARVPLFLPVLCASRQKGEEQKRKKKKKTEIEEKRMMTLEQWFTTVVALCVVAIVAVLHSWVVAWQGLRQFRCDSCGMAHSIRCSLK